MEALTASTGPVQAESEEGKPHPPMRLGEALVARGLLRPEDLDWALRIQAQTRERLGQILLSRGLVRRYDLYQTLADLWGVPFVDLLQEPPDPELLHRFRPEEILESWILPLRETPEGLEIATARRPDAALLEEAARRFGGPVARVRATTEWDIRRTLLRFFRTDVLASATYGLYYRRPEESAHTVFTRSQFFAFALALMGTLLGLALAPRLTLVLLNGLVNFFFMASVVFKFVVSMVGARYERETPILEEEVAALKDEELPRYTILVPVYREASVIGSLLANLKRLDYPPEKLEILLLIEEDDRETLEAAKAARPPGNVCFILIPDQIPKTKPKACNVGLFFASGDYLVIYDAEDRPDPDQLKKAVLAFRKGGPRLICVQAALNYFNARENFLTRMFTLEYSYWFDYMLPGLYRLGMPIPLGGTSNHFPTERLRELGGWDPFNVTEDADLGIRAIVEGFEVGVIPSTTYEEANTRVGNWIRQRSRWIKGYMQTALVHARNPWRLIRRIGLRRTLGFFLLVAGTPLTFLSAPWMWLMFAWWAITRTHALDPFFPPPVLYVSLFNLLIGNAIGIYLNMLAGFKRGYYDLIPWALLNPIYWVLHSIAAYKALWQLFTRPFYWEKTTHGLSRWLGDIHGNPEEGNA
ncbi:Beta-monoglucosyldiacylglycerol synthase [Candidatus Thermoflexus japonica]|uniref:Beta-monoglucosyldiacylglycerol synthase n=1 Tax=Candidatus Thermoflexus japonica TaxID=2035417 RepID=A0A2H5Y8T1_9CHLR|nr:Beta-monoglucosyldiacylglycerol synthase [Candidatus Thermoflexus japonica]